jgi:hypothetical protein
MAAEAKEPSIPNMVEIYRSQGHMRANAAKSKLEAAGIPALLRYDSASLIFGLTVDGIGLVRVLVPEQYATQAEELLVEDVSWEDESAQEEPPQEAR